MSEHSAKPNGTQSQNVIIIGGSSGIGLATAKLAYQQGAIVTITGTSELNVARAAQEIGAITTHVLDVTNEVQVNQFFSQFTTIDHVYVAAGTTRLGSILDGSLSDQLTAFDLRVRGSLHVVAGSIGQNPAGRIDCFYRRLIYRPARCRCLGIGHWYGYRRATGSCTRPRTSPRSLQCHIAWLFGHAHVGNCLGDNRQLVLDSVARSLPVKRIAQPAEVAEAIIFLMRNESVTGEVLHVDGGARLI